MKALRPRKSATQEQVIALDKANRTLWQFNMTLVSAYLAETLISFMNGYFHAPADSFNKNDGLPKTFFLLFLNLLLSSSHWLNHDAFQPNLSSEQANRSLRTTQLISSWKAFIILSRSFLSHTLCPISWNDIVTSCTEKGCLSQATLMQSTMPFIGMLIMNLVDTALDNTHKESQKERENNNRDLSRILNDAIIGRKIHIAESATKPFRKLELNKCLKITEDKIGITLHFIAPRGNDDLPCVALARIAVDFLASTLPSGSQILYEDNSDRILLRMSDERFAYPKQIDLAPLLEQFDRFFTVLAFLEPQIAGDSVKSLVLDGECLYLLPNNPSDEALTLLWNEDETQQNVRGQMRNIHKAKKDESRPTQHANLPLAPRPQIQTQAHYEQISNAGAAKPRTAKSDGKHRIFALSAAQQQAEDEAHRDFGDYGLYAPNNPLADNDATIIRRIDMDDGREIYVKATKNDNELLAQFKDLNLAQRRFGNKGMILTLAPENSLSNGSPVLAKIKRLENESFVATTAVQVALKNGRKATLLIFDGRTIKHNNPAKWPKNKDPGIIVIEPKRSPAASF